LPNWALGVSTGLTATVFAVGYLRRPSVRLIVRYLAFAPLVIGFWFIWTLPSSLKGEITEAANLHLEEVKRPTPIVMVIFDELPTASLIDEKGGLLSEHFPG